MSRYTSVTDPDRAAMLDAIGVGSLEEIFEAQIPAGVRLQGGLDLPDGLPEQDVYAHLLDLSKKNTSAEDEITFLGAGMYDHYIPAAIDMLLGRSEFLTPYTPYQPEVSQGGLQVMFEYQTAICELTGLDVSNASVYEGPSAVAAAGYLAKLAAPKRPRYLVSAALHPDSRTTLETLSVGYGTDVVEIPLKDGATDLDALKALLDEHGDEVSAVIFQQPNFLGAIEDVQAISDLAHAQGALSICQADPIALGVLEAPGNQGVDVCVGEGQALGNRLDFGGPSFGFFAATNAHVRRMPGRIAGETADADGRRGFVLTLQTREQHIRREKATSNICTSQALNALAGVVYLTWLGRDGLVELGELLVQRTHYARQTLTAIDGVTALHDQPVVREFAIQLPADVEVSEVVSLAQDRGVNPGFDLGRVREDWKGGLLVALTEQRSKSDIDTLASVLAESITAARNGERSPLSASVRQEVAA
ncbi:MAG: aminomethyl-transferring glycine dehydrogenase subunit GcvPA [Solirubrobacteraceae bacterium]|nr:aminomethyl-transferring glycine dehydrogenase subunit GcvPA [Patulibacter sp.]